MIIEDLVDLACAEASDGEVEAHGFKGFDQGVELFGYPLKNHFGRSHQPTNGSFVPLDWLRQRLDVSTEGHLNEHCVAPIVGCQVPAP